MVLGVKVTPASVQDREGAVLLLASLYLLLGRLQIIWADGGYAGVSVAWVKALRPDHSESHTYVCMSRLMLKRLAKEG